jgi:hypothetical protein
MAKKLNEADSGANFTDKTWLEFYKKALTAKQTLELAQEIASSANGVYRGVLKAARKAGVDSSVIAQVLGERMQDQDEITARQQAYIRLRVLAGVFTPTKQDDLLAGAQKGGDIDAARAYDDGLFAGSKGENRGNNKHHAGSEEFDAWDRGWLDGQKRLAQTLKPKPAPRVPRKGKVDGGVEAGAVN